MGYGLNTLERRIARLSRRSKLAPAEFLNSELKRFITIQQLRAILPGEIFPETMVECLEQEFAIYFEPETTTVKLSPSWKYPYCGSDGVMEEPILTAGLAKVLPKLGLGYIRNDSVVNHYRFVDLVEAGELPNLVRRYFTSIGFLYPYNDRTLQVHGNARLAQYGTLIAASGNSFLSRNHLRVPFYEAKSQQTFSEGLGTALTERELWKFWSDVLALEVSGDRQPYWRDSFHRSDKGLPLKRKLQESLELGRCLVPQRYICPEPKIEEFGWQEDSLGKYLAMIKDKLHLT